VCFVDVCGCHLKFGGRGFGGIGATGNKQADPVGIGWMGYSTPRDLQA
jgi:hypothetical protein